MDVAKVKRDNLVGTVFEALRAEILSGKLKDGECLPPQEELAERFGVSRTVLREALNRLSSLGLIDAQQGRGTFVRSLSPSSAVKPILNALSLDEASTRELIEARFHLEKAAVRLAARRATADHVAGLKSILDSMVRHVDAGDLEGFSADDLAFHLALAEATGNRILRRVLETIREMMYRFLEEFNRIKGAPARALAYHEKILDAIADHDADKAEAEMAAHLLDVSRIVEEQYHYDIDV